MTLTRLNCILRFICLAVAAAASAYASITTDFLTRAYRISHETVTYTNVVGLSGGPSLSNFSSDLRTPGYPLFLFATTFGRLPHENVIKVLQCDEAVFQVTVSCASAEIGADVVVRIPPRVYGYSAEIGGLFARIAFVAKFLFVGSCVVLFWALSYWVNPILALGVIAAVWYVFDPTSQYTALNLLQSEMLFPALFFLYVASLLLYGLKSKFSNLWMIISSLLAVYIFLVRPAFLYVPCGHFLWLCYLFFRCRKSAAAVMALMIGATFVWLVLLSPISFFSVANQASDLVRVAMFGDQRTVDCVPEQDVKIALTAFFKSIYRDPTIVAEADKLNNDMDRYYYFSGNNLYRIDRETHPIYKDLSIAGLLDKKGVLPESLVHRMATEGGRCTKWRNVRFFGLVTAMTLGLTPQLSSHAPRKFFSSSLTIFVAVGLIVIALLTLFLTREFFLASIIVVTAGIYTLLLFIVALKQGGEERYLGIVEPMFVLATAMSAAVLISRIGVCFRSQGRATVLITLAALFGASAYAARSNPDFFGYYLLRELPPRPIQGLWIHTATYGKSCGAPRGNATKQIGAACNGKVHCSYVVDVNQIGDPAPGCRKDYLAVYACVPRDREFYGKSLPAEAGFGSVLEIDCP